MSRIENVNNRVNLNRYCKPKQTKNVSFSGGAKEIKNAEKLIGEYLPGQVKFFQFFNKCKSDEATNIIVNAVGTAIFAPLMIAYNPISKVDKNDKQGKLEEKNTRHYSALRQPVSAVLAVITQVGITKPFDNILNNMANNGELGEKYDLRIKQNNAFLTKEAKQKYAGKTKEEYNNLSKKDKEATVKSWVEKESKAQEAKALELMKKHGTITIEDAKGELHKMNKGEFYELMTKTAADFKKDYIETVKSDYVNERISKQFKRSNYLFHDSTNAKTVVKKALEIIENPPKRSAFKEKLHNAKNSFLINIMHKKPEDIKEPEFVKPPLDDYIKELKKKGIEQADGSFAKANPELISILEESQVILNKGTINDKLKKQIDHIDKSVKLGDETAILNKITEKVTGEYRNLETLSKQWDGLIDTIKGGSQDSVHFENILKETEKVKTCLVKNGKKVTENNGVDFMGMVMEKHLSKVDHIFKSNKSMVGLIVSFAMVPITCTALNWTYPVFVDTFFPHLSNKKKGGK